MAAARRRNISIGSAARFQAIWANPTASIGPSYPYAHTSSLFDVVSGSNGTCLLQPSYFCNATTGYDGPTGLGTPNTAGAF